MSEPLVFCSDCPAPHQCAEADECCAEEFLVAKAADEYLIWSNEHTGWWAIAGWGYTKSLKSAGHFTRQFALETCRNAIPGSRHGVFNEVPVRLADVEEFMKDALIPAGLL